ncbi:hypothetical protein GGF31_006508 [Allomyces arbusculus]|nr:hypothetical protein GGF31_006508 [Allomyces arbusculus]
MVFRSLVHFRASAADTVKAAVAQEFALKTAQQVAMRAAATHVFMSRWGLERMVHDLTARGLNEGQRTLMIARVGEANEALKKSTSLLELTPLEQEFIAKEVGTSTLSDIAALEGRWEGFGILLHALHLLPAVPPYYRPFPMVDLLSATGIVPAEPKTIESFLGRAHQLVPEPALVAALNQAEAWYWRARAQVLLKLKEAIDDPSCDSSDIKKLPKALRDMTKHIDVTLLYATSRSLQDGLIDKALLDDFAIPADLTSADAPATNADAGWKRYLDATDDEAAQLRVIAEDRLAALAWVMAGREWDAPRDEVSFVNPMSSLWQPTNE